MQEHTIVAAWIMKKTQAEIKDPMQINYEDSTEQILEQIMDAIEQSKKFKPVKEQTTA